MERYYLAGIPRANFEADENRRGFDFGDYKTVNGRSLTNRIDGGGAGRFNIQRPRASVHSKLIRRSDKLQTPSVIVHQMSRGAAPGFGEPTALVIKKSVLTPSGPVLVKEPVASTVKKPTAFIQRKQAVFSPDLVQHTVSNPVSTANVTERQIVAPDTTTSDFVANTNTPPEGDDKKGSNMLLWGIGIATGLFLASEATGISNVTGMASKKKSGGLNGTPTKKTSTNTKAKPADRSAKRTPATKKRRPSKKPVSVTL